MQSRHPGLRNILLVPRFDGGVALVDQRRATRSKAVARVLDRVHQRAATGVATVFMVTATILTHGSVVPLLGWALLVPALAALLMPSTRWDGVMLELHTRHALVMTPSSHRKVRRVSRFGLTAVAVPGVEDKFHVELVTLSEGRFTIAWQVPRHEADALVDVINAYAAAASNEPT